MTDESAEISLEGNNECVDIDPFPWGIEVQLESGDQVIPYEMIVEKADVGSDVKGKLGGIGVRILCVFSQMLREGRFNADAFLNEVIKNFKESQHVSSLARTIEGVASAYLIAEKYSNVQCLPPL